MTVIPGDSGAVVPFDPNEFDNLGMEDVSASDIAIPRLRIEHGDAEFKDSLSGATFRELDVILLGLVKQRIMWDDDVEDKEQPLCKSPDFEHGFPQTSLDVPAEKRFPWAKGNFDPANFPPEKGLNGLVTLPCSACVFSEWDKNGWKQPPCAEQHTYPLLYSADGGDSYTPALLTLQKTGIKPSRQYISSFAQAKTPMFTVFTKLSLTQLSRGSVKYCVPVLKRGEQTPRDNWQEYANALRSIRDFVRQPPRRLDEDETEAAPSANVNSGPPAAATAAPAQTATVATPSTTATAAPPASETVAVATPTTAVPASAPVTDDDLPF